MSLHRSPSCRHRGAGFSLRRVSATIICSSSLLVAGVPAAHAAAPLTGTSQVKWDGQSGNYRPHSAVVGDINADGKDDIAFGKGNTVTLLYGSSTSADLDLDSDLATRGLRLTLPSGASVADVEPAGDFDDDGRDDLVISTGSNAYVFFGQPGTATGTLAVVGSGRVTDISALGERSEGIGDFDGDGIDDLAVGRLNGSAIVYGGGRANAINANVKGTRASAITATQTCGYIFVVFKTCSYNSGSFSPVGDINGDGKADLALNSNQLSYLAAKRHVLFGRSGIFSTSAGTPTNAMALPASLGEYLPKAVGDVNGDGRGDLWYAGTTWEIGPGEYGAEIMLGVASPPASLDRTTTPKVWIRNAAPAIAIGDQDGDGRSDVVVGLGGGDTYAVRTVGLPTGSGGIVDSSSAAQVGGLRPGFSAIGAGDFDGDSIDDLLFHNGLNLFVLATRGADGVPPQLAAASMTPVRFSASEGTRFSVTVDDRATLELTYRQNGAQVASEQRAVSSGTSEVRFTGVVGGTTLGVGSYTVDIVPVDASGNRGALRTITFELAAEGGPASATLSGRTTVLAADGSVATTPWPTIQTTANCGFYSSPSAQQYLENGDTDLSVGGGLRAGDGCSITSDVTFAYDTAYAQCRWTDSYTFNGQPVGAGPYTLVAGPNRWTRLRRCAAEGTDLPTSFSGFKLSGNAEVDGAMIKLTSALAGQTGSAVWERARDYNGRTIEFEAKFVNGNGAAEGIAMAFLNSGASGPVGGYLGVGGQQMGFGGLSGVALAFDVSKGENDPMGNFIGWADGARGNGLNWLQTGDAGLRLRGVNWVKVKVAFTGGKAQVFLNGVLRMERAMTLSTQTHLAFTAATSATTYEQHFVRALRISNS